MDEIEFSALLVIQSFRSDSFFSAEQQEQLSELMNAWRSARDQGQELSPEQHAELNGLVETELRAATACTSVLAQQGNSCLYYIAIAQRANHRCEYCKAPEVVFNFPFEVEPIVPLSRQGSNDEANLALACRSCNLRKGNRISGFSSRSNVEARFFHPREDHETTEEASSKSNI